MKVISLWQPWASLLVTRRPYPDCGGCGAYQHDVSYHDDDLPMVKTVETRSWSCPPKLIGQRIAFHATQTFPVEGRRWMAEHDDLLHSFGWCFADDVNLPLGAIVGSGIVAVSLPIVGMADCTDHGEHVCHQVGGGLLHHRDIHAPISETDISDQLPYGDYTPGRFAWIITDAVPCTPIPYRGRQGFFNVPDDIGVTT